MSQSWIGMVSSLLPLDQRSFVEATVSLPGQAEEASFNARSPRGIKDIYFTFARLYIFYK